MRIGLAIALPMAAVLASAQAQTVVRKVTVASGSSTVHYGEVAIIGSPVNSNEALVAMLKVGGGGGIGFQTTAQAFSDLPRPPLTPPCYHRAPRAAASRLIRGLPPPPRMALSM